MEQAHAPYSGVYRLFVEGILVGEFVPGPLWSETYQHFNETRENVTYKWMPFVQEPVNLPKREDAAYPQALVKALDEREPADVLTAADAVYLAEALRVLNRLVSAVKEVSQHVPERVENGWISCSCKHDIRPGYWARHVQGANGSSLADLPIEEFRDVRFKEFTL